MANVKMDAGAKYLLANVQHQAGTISAQTEQKLLAKAEAQEAPLSAQQVQQILLDAMPEQSAAVKSAWDSCKKVGYGQADADAKFKTSFVDVHLIQKEQNVAVRPNRTQPARRPGRDPLYAKFMMDPDAKSMLLFNGRDVDANGKPLLMKAVLRVSDPGNVEQTEKEMAAFRETMGNFNQFRSHWGEKAAGSDIMVIGPTDAYVETADMQEIEFQFGDPLLQISLDAKEKEISRGVAVRPKNELILKYYAADAAGQPNLAQPVRSGWNTGNTSDTQTGEQLDTTRPQVFTQRVRTQISAKEGTDKGQWLSTPATAFELGFSLDPGLIFEPGKQAKVSYLGTGLDTAVAADDAFFTGSPSAAGKPNLAPHANRALSWLMNQPVQVAVSSPGAPTQDAFNESKALRDYVFAEAANIAVGGKTLAPLGDVTLNHAQLNKETGVHASLIPAADKEFNGTRISVQLDAGFLKTEKDTSIEGWKVAVGFMDHEGNWQQCDEVKIADSDKSQEMRFMLESGDAPALVKSGRRLEIRVYNDGDVPAQRVMVPFQELKWDMSAIKNQKAKSDFSPSQICGQPVVSESAVKTGGKIAQTEDGHLFFVQNGTASSIDALQAKRLQSLS
jgi:hypothetical protein